MFRIINARSRTTFWEGLFTDMAALDVKAGELRDFDLHQSSQGEIGVLTEPFEDV